MAVSGERYAEICDKVEQLQKKIEELEAQVREWNYLTDEESYPPMDMEVNVWLDYARRDVATMRYGGRDEWGNPFWLWHNSDDSTTLTPKAWQHLPEPPIKKDAE